MLGEGGSSSVASGAGGSGGEPYVEERHNSGDFCIGNESIYYCIPTDIPEAEAFDLYVNVGCACDEGERDAGCQVEVVDSTLVVESWYVWIVVDVISVGLYWWKDLHLTAALYLIFLAMCVVAAIRWRPLVVREVRR